MTHADADQPPPPFFDPVPGRARHDGWTPLRQRVFIAALARLGVVDRAAQAVGMSRKSAYALRRRAGEESGFARAWDAVLDRAVENAQWAGLELALHGEEVPVFYRGKQVGSYRRYDSRLTLAVLRAYAARRGMPDTKADLW